jgi:hypothetical protein
MVRSLVLRFVSCVALVCMGVAAVATSASAQTNGSHYSTAITQVYGSTYPLTGRLDLQLMPDGTVRGYYHTTYNKLYIQVAGGRDGNYIWFDIGPSSTDLGLGAGPEGKLHVVATMNSDGSFRGQVYPETAAVLSGLSMQYQFGNPPPGSASAPDQYIFTATPMGQVAPGAQASTPQP